MALPDQIYAHASPKSISGRSLFESEPQIQSSNVAGFFSDDNIVVDATARLQRAGFEILQVTAVTINFSGNPDVFEKAFQTKIIEKEMSRPNGPTTTYLDSPKTEMMGHVSTSGTNFENVIEGIALEVPRIFLSPSPIPPSVDYPHLEVPADVASGCNATVLHELGITGLGVKVAMVDSGWYRHPYFVAQNYNVAPVVLGPAATAPEHDESGHGTGESANILALAPQCEFHPVKMNFVNSVGAFNAAVALNPDIITCSWGSHSPFELTAADMVLAASVAAAVASGIVVIFSAGNGHAGFPGQHPDILSAGGVHVRPDGSLEASNYSSAFTSTIFTNRRVPDVCGLVGMRPKAIYIMLPVEPGDKIDTGNAGSVFPDGDQTEPDDGWAAFSGTSAAAPQLAGAAALIRQVVPSASTATVKNALATTARSVTEGNFSPVNPLNNGLPAISETGEPNAKGLVDVYSAVVAAYTDSMSSPTEASADISAEEVAAYYYGLAGAASATSANPILVSYLQGFADAAAALADS